MPKRQLTEHETILVNRLKERARIKAEMVWLESKMQRYRKHSTTDQRIAELRARLEALQAEMEADKQSKAPALKG